jgi:hypothetical protein
MWIFYDAMIKAIISDVPRIESNDVDVCHAYDINVLMMLRMNNVHWIAWEIRFCTNYDFWKTKIKKLANSEITSDDFADSEPGAKFSVFPKTVTSSLGSAMTIGELSSQPFCNKHLLITSSNECTLPIKVSKGKRAWTTINRIDSV